MKRNRLRLALAITTPLIAALILAGVVLAAYWIGQADAFDRGMAAGMEYEAWFCHNAMAP